MIISRASCGFALLGLSSALSGVFAQNANTSSTTSYHTTVIILGGGMAGIIAARTLHEQGIDDFIILDAKTELGGRMIPKAFGVTGRQVVVEMGPNWVQGTQEGNGTANPVWELAIKHNLTTVYNDMYGSVSMCIIHLVSCMPSAHGSQLLMTTGVIIIIPTCSIRRLITSLRPPSSQVY
jgi:polyamine oxidase